MLRSSRVLRGFYVYTDQTGVEWLVVNASRTRGVRQTWYFCPLWGPLKFGRPFTTKREAVRALAARVAGMSDDHRRQLLEQQRRTLSRLDRADREQLTVFYGAASRALTWHRTIRRPAASGAR